jgi:hypothetical protein
MTKHRFLLCNLTPNIISQPHWYVVLEPGDVELLEQLHRQATLMFAGKFGNKHAASWGPLYDPITLGAKWLQSIEHFLEEGPLLVNQSTGFHPIPEELVIHEERLSETWPGEEVIVISKWPGGIHFYLHSSIERSFAVSRFPTYEAARQEAEKYTPNVKTKGFT